MMSRTAPLRLSAALLLVMSAAAQAGPAEDLSKAATAALAGLQVSGATFGEAREEGSNLVFTGVTFASTGQRAVGVKVNRITVTGGASGDSLQNARVLLEGVEGTGSDGPAYRADRVDVANAQGSLAALLASLAAGEPLFSGASQAALTGFSSERIDIPSLTITRRQMGRTDEGIYRNVRFNRFARGKIGEITIGGLSTSTQQGPAGPKVEIGQIRLTGVDATAAIATGTTSTVALESGTIEQVRSASQTGQPFSIERLIIGKITMRPGERSLLAITESIRDIDPSATDDAGRRRSIGAAAEIFSRLDIERIEMVNFKGQSPTNEDISMERMAFVGLSQGKLGSIEVNGMAAPANNGQRGRIARFAIEGIDGSGLVALGKEISEGRFAQGQTVPPAAYPDIRRVLFEGVAVTDRTGQSLGKVERFEVEAGPRIGLVPTRLRARMTGFEAPVTDPIQRAQMAPLGIEDKILLSSEFELEYVEAARELRLRNLNITVADVGALTLAMTIGGLERQQIEGLPGTAATLGLAAKAGPLTLSYTEDGAVASLLTHTAEQAGVEEDAFTEQLKEQASALIGQFIQDKALAASIRTAVNAFLDDPNSLTISATPKGELPLAALAMAARSSPLALLPMLNIQVRANR
ncbi:hypothetical protein E8L99_13790 [Phreatobacter aquaticus]|uniref:Uncharacterized protein n=1 Tax=Phreatobacter aquaticus TaxID=2570229 RepID=A0A4D7QJD2_9HYPH|nr:hypothetical protein [Phreatobacter aquaticus]QCK86751.1 hypothetical protein E8L99_13790 [Phreatobacter aquaticus]